MARGGEVTFGHGCYAVVAVLTVVKLNGLSRPGVSGSDWA